LVPARNEVVMDVEENRGPPRDPRWEVGLCETQPKIGALTGHWSAQQYTGTT